MFCLGYTVFVSIENTARRFSKFEKTMWEKTIFDGHLCVFLQDEFLKKLLKIWTI